MSQLLNSSSPYQETISSILQLLENNHDANSGISWDSIGCALDSLAFE